MTGKFELKKANNDQYHFVLKAANHQIVGQSQMYATEATRDNGIRSCQSHAPTACQGTSSLTQLGDVNRYAPGRLR